MSKTYEEKLQAIIEAQVKGGCDKYDEYNYDHMEIEDGYSKHWVDSTLDIHVLLILLDTQGLKAAYGERKCCNGCGSVEGGRCCPDDTLQFNVGMKKYRDVGIRILDAWNSDNYSSRQESGIDIGGFTRHPDDGIPEGNNWKAAIDTAYDLLPTK